MWSEWAPLALQPPCPNGRRTGLWPAPRKGIEGRYSGDGRLGKLFAVSPFFLALAHFFLREESFLSIPSHRSIICQDKDAIMVFVWTTFGNDVARKLDLVKGKEERESVCVCVCVY